MGNIFRTQLLHEAFENNENNEKTKGEHKTTPFQKFNKSSAFVKIYVDGNRLLYVSKGPSTVHKSVTMFEKKIEKKTDKLTIFFKKNTSFTCTLLFTNDNDELQISQKIKQSNSKDKSGSSFIVQENLKRLHYFSIFIPSHDENLYLEYPEDMFSLLHQKEIQMKIPANLLKETLEKNKRVEKKKVALRKKETLEEGFDGKMWTCDGRIEKR